MNHFVSGAIEAARLKRVEWERTLPALLEKEFNAVSKLESLVGSTSSRMRRIFIYAGQLTMGLTPWPGRPSLHR